MKLAAVDIGTNAVRLLVGEVATNYSATFIKKHCYTRVPLRLGEEVFDNGWISEQKLNDFLKVMKSFKLISEVFEVKQLRVCATSAMREAKNAKEVTASIYKHTGLLVEIISGKEEANLIFSAFPFLRSNAQIPYVVIDVGGGSTEISVFEDGKRLAAKSFELGTLRMVKGKTTKTVWEKIRLWVNEQVNLSVNHEVFATGGNINKAHKILGGKYMEPISLNNLQHLREELHLASIKERVINFQLKPDRVDVIVPALDIYLHVLNALGAEKVVVPKIGLADGIMFDMYMSHHKNLH